MRNILIAGLAAGALCACANPEIQRQAAINDCQQVGISASDPQFETCTKAMGLSRHERSLIDAYRNATNAVPQSRRFRQTEPFLY